VIGAALLVIVFITAWAAGRQSAGPVGDGGTDAARLGPLAGEDVAAYLARTRDVAPGDGPRLELVQLDAPQPSTASGVLLPGASGGAAPLQAVQAVFRVPLARVQTAVRRVDLRSSDPGAAVPAAEARAAAQAAADAASAPPGRLRDVAQAEASLLGGGPGAPCPCLVALVVRGDVTGLTALARAPGVRAVQVAPPGAAAGRLAVSPLLPEQGEGRPLGPVVGPVPDDGPVPEAGR